MRERASACARFDPIVAFTRPSYRGARRNGRKHRTRQNVSRYVPQAIRTNEMKKNAFFVLPPKKAKPSGRYIYIAARCLRGETGICEPGCLTSYSLLGSFSYFLRASFSVFAFFGLVRCTGAILPFSTLIWGCINAGGCLPIKSRPPTATRVVAL